MKARHSFISIHETDRKALISLLSSNTTALEFLANLLKGENSNSNPS